MTLSALTSPDCPTDYGRDSTATDMVLWMKGLVKVVRVVTAQKRFGLTHLRQAFGVKAIARRQLALIFTIVGTKERLSLPGALRVLAGCFW